MFDSESYKFLGPPVLHLLVSVFLANNFYLNILEFLGMYFSIGILSWLIYETLQTIYNTWVGVWLNRNTNLKQMGSWAVVTGASDGIGLAYCKELARMGINVVLMSRTLEKLQKCAKMLEADFGVDTMVIQVDFSEGVEAYEKVEVLLRGMDIGVLFNNVGMTYPSPSHFHEVATPKFINDIININALAVTMMSKIVLPGMLERGKGVIVNVGSYVSCNFSPWFALYGASKAYMEKLTDDLALEYKDRGIIFQYQLPGYVSTKLRLNNLNNKFLKDILIFLIKI